MSDKPLPPGIRGCPLSGCQILVSSREDGSGSFWKKASRKLGNSKIYRYFFMGKRWFVITGGSTLKQIMNTEYQKDGLYVQYGSSNYLGPTMIWEPNEAKHTYYLRKLVGQALTPSAVKRAIPNLIEASQHQINRMLENNKYDDGDDANERMVIAADDICSDFTLKVAWKQILGLKLNSKQGEELEFVSNVNDWIAGLVDPRISLQILGATKTRGYQAKLYLERKIEERIQDLETNGPDASTLSGMGLCDR